MLHRTMTMTGAIHHIRGWLRSDMLKLRWVFLGLYLALLACLSVPFFFEGEMSVAWAILAGIMLVSQALFVLGAGTIHLCRPIRKRRLWMPVLAAAFMLMVLTVYGGLALWELFQWPDAPGGDFLIWFIMGGVWLGWGVILWAYARRWQRIGVLRRLAVLCFAGSLAELVAAVPSHVIVSKRPGCLVGLWTMLGICAGIYVMLFSFGPGIVLLFLRPRYRRERMEGGAFCPQCDYDLRATTGPTCPECGATIRDHTALQATATE